MQFHCTAATPAPPAAQKSLSKFFNSHSHDNGEVEHQLRYLGIISDTYSLNVDHAPFIMTMTDMHCFQMFTISLSCCTCIKVLVVKRTFLLCVQAYMHDALSGILF